MPGLLYHKRFILLPLIVFTVFLGCEKPEKHRPADLPELIPCEITVMMDGKPLTGGGVRLQPVSTSSSKSWSIVGTTNESGVAKMQTYGDFIGVPEGEYIVLIAKSQVSVAPSDASPEERLRIEHLPAKVIVNPSFNDPAQTPLKISVSGKGPVKETFEVKGY